MVEPVTMTLAALAAATAHLVGKAAVTFGREVFEQLTDDAAEDAAGLGRRLLGRMIRGRTTPAEVAVAEATRRVVEAPDDSDAVASLRLKILNLLQGNPDVEAEARDLLQNAPASMTASALAVGERAVAVAGSENVVITGNDVRLERGGQ